RSFFSPLKSTSPESVNGVTRATAVPYSFFISFLNRESIIFKIQMETGVQRSDFMYLYMSSIKLAESPRLSIIISKYGAPSGQYFPIRHLATLRATRLRINSLGVVSRYNRKSNDDSVNDWAVGAVMLPQKETSR